MTIPRDDQATAAGNDEKTLDRFEATVPIGKAVFPCVTGQFVLYADAIARIAALEKERDAHDMSFLPSLRLKITQGGLSIAEQCLLHKIARKGNAERVRLLRQVRILTTVCDSMHTALVDLATEKGAR